jgi:Glyoxalase-like domain
MRVASIRDIVFDSPRPSVIARFWAQALDLYDVAPYDDAELARLRAAGITDISDDPSVLVEPSATAAGPMPRLFFQLVPESKVVKNRVHLDLSAVDLAAEIARLTALGATVVAEYDGRTVLADPDGNEFCVGGTKVVAAGG